MNLKILNAFSVVRSITSFTETSMISAILAAMRGM